MVLEDEYPLPSPRWAFEATRYNENHGSLRIDVKAPVPHNFSCVVLIPLGKAPPRRQPAGPIRKQLAIAKVRSYLNALHNNSLSGQYVS